jgi:RNA polymerase sigma factor (sigma-70 family)
LKRSFLDSVLRGAEALAARDGVGTLPDPDLVRRFAAGRDPAAFAVLVRRHGPLVWGVCRNLLPADADAEDAFQATFLALVRSAAGIRRTESLAGWLHGVAYRVALKARRAAARRKKREVVAAVPEPTSPVPDAAWDELQAAVHEEVCKLPDKLRLPFVLCGLQGRPQKEAAEVLGWKVGTVSGRLTEARRRLLDRLARRGVPVGVAVGAAVLGGVAGRAAVPFTFSAKVLSLSGSPAGVSQTVLSLARGVTPMYLTRTKLLAAGLVLVGVLTTGVGVLSKADAQAPPNKNYADELKKYYDALRSHEAPKDRWEYKFIPVDKPLTTADLRKVLAGADQEGWGYCGSQELADEKTGKISPHMVFKRSRAGVVGDEDGVHREALDALKKERAALFDQLKTRDLELAKQKADAERAMVDAVHARKLADAKVASDQAARDAALRDREMALKLAREQEAKALEVIEQARKQEAALQQERAAAEKALRMADEKAQVDRARQQDLDAMKAKYEEVIRQLQAELKSKSIPAGGKGLPQADASNPFRSNAGQSGSDEVITAIVKLRHIDGKTAAAALGKVLPQAKIIAEVSPDSIMLKGPGKLVMEGREIIQMKLDVPAADGSASESKLDVAMIQLKYVKADHAAKMLDKVGASKTVRISFDSATNSVFVAAPPDELVKLKKFIQDLDKSTGPAK